MKQQVKYYNNFIHWYFNGNLHRDGDLPAKYYFRDRKLIAIHYHHHDKLHRTTGPAYIYYKRKIKWYIYQGKQYGSLEQMLMMEACR